jgi:hypothetical protein
MTQTLSEILDMVVKNASDANWGAVKRAMKIMEAGFKKRPTTHFLENLDRNMKQQAEFDRILNELHELLEKEKLDG